MGKFEENSKELTKSLLDSIFDNMEIEFNIHFMGDVIKHFRGPLQKGLLEIDDFHTIFGTIEVELLNLDEEQFRIEKVA